MDRSPVLGGETYGASMHGWETEVCVPSLYTFYVLYNFISQYVSSIMQMLRHHARDAIYKIYI